MERGVIVSENTRLTYRIRRNLQRTAARVLPKETLVKLYYRFLLGRPLDLKNPRTFNEKLQWYKLYYCDGNDLIVQCTDKYSVRRYVEDRGYGGILNPLLGVWDRVDDIDWDVLPKKFVLKCTHGSGYNIICLDKSKMDKKQVQSTLRRWLREDFGLFNLEPHYDRIQKRIIAEEFIEWQGGLPVDYKFFCFHGQPKMIGVYKGRYSNLEKHYYDLNWKPMAISMHGGGGEVDKPKLLPEAIEISTRLAQDFPFVRVDLYDCNTRIIFGELTFSPAAGFHRFTHEGDVAVGEWFDLHKV